MNLIKLQQSRKRPIFLLVLGCILLPFILILSLYPKKTSEENGISIPASATLYYKSEWNARQSQNSCGPYSAAAVIRNLTNNTISSEAISQATPWRYHGYTLPLGVTHVLRKNNIITTEAIVAGSDEDKTRWLRTHLAQQKPVILLGRKHGLLHYVTILGYKDDQFFVYDSLEEKGAPGMTVDKNDALPGNTNWTNTELLTFWSQGGLFGLYRYYAIVASTN